VSSVPSPDHGAQFVCACCHDAGYLPSVTPGQPYQFEPCSSCHQDCFWTTVGDDGRELIGLAALARFRPVVN
jgi:hypothetical protein